MSHAAEATDRRVLRARDALDHAVDHGHARPLDVPLPGGCRLSTGRAAGSGTGRATGRSSFPPMGSHERITGVP